MSPSWIELDLEARRRVPMVTVALSFGALILFLAPLAGSALGYDRAMASHAWRFVTCHWVHWNVEHFAWSVGTFFLLGLLCEWKSRGRFLACVLGATVAIPMALWLVMPGLARYGGLSGLDSALFALVAVTLLREHVRTRDWTWVAGSGLLLAAFAAKVGYEFTTSAPVFVSEDVPLTPVPLAHLVGGAVGALAALLPWHSRATPPAATQEEDGCE